VLVITVRHFRGRAMDNVVVIPELLLPACMFESCTCAMSTEYMARHLREKHAFSKEDLANTMEKVEKELSSISLSVQQESLRADYLRAGSGPESSEALLPVIPSLPVVPGLRCRSCLYLCTSADTLRKHANAVHIGESLKTDGSSGLGEVIRDPEVVWVQSIFGGNKKKFFAVSFDPEEFPGE